MSEPKRRASRRLRGVGIALVLLGLLGFVTVADDLRHTGELLGVGSVALSGLVLVVLSVRRAA